MSDPGNNSVNANGNPRRPPNVDLRAFVNALMRQVQAQLALSHAATISKQLLQKITDIVRANLAPLSALLTTAGLAMFLPSLAVVIVNGIGFTSGGVLAGASCLDATRSEFVCSLFLWWFLWVGSLATVIQSHFYGALTRGVFSSLQAFGATAAIASPAVLVLGGILLGTGAGLFGWWLYKKWRGGGDDDPPSQGVLVVQHNGREGDSDDAERK